MHHPQLRVLVSATFLQVIKPWLEGEGGVSGLIVVPWVIVMHESGDAETVEAPCCRSAQLDDSSRSIQ
jgi:hypothetical protein